MPFERIPRRRPAAIWMLGILPTLLGACADRSAHNPPVAISMASYDTAALVAARLAKDSTMANADSPLPEEVRRGFRGLSYYPPNRSLAFRGRIERFERQEPARLMATGGDARQMLRYGTFWFRVSGELCSLVVYKSDARDPRLFLPFKDATNGSETYEVGRYLDLEERPDPDGEYEVDFNLSYNPYCAYNDGYSCPIVPASNVLDVPIKAGERLPVWGNQGE